MPALAAILIYTGYKLAKPSIFIDLYKKGIDQFIPFLATVVVIIFTDLLTGIIIGIGIGLFFVIRSNFKSSLMVVHDSNRYLFRFKKMSLLNKPLLKGKPEKVPANSFILINLMRADIIDKDVEDVINNFRKYAALKNIKVEVKRSVMQTSHQTIQIKEEVFQTI